MVFFATFIKNLTLKKVQCVNLKTTILRFSSFLFLFFISGCEQQPVSVEQQDLYVINVLDKAMYENCHIAGSIQLELEEVEAFVKNLKKNTELVIYCSNYMCSASGQIAKKLKNLGFTQVWAYEGGVAEWYQMGLPVKGICSDTYLNKKMSKVEQEAEEFEAITAQELYEKMKNHHLL